MSRDWRLYVSDIVHACEKVRRYAAGLSRDAFFEDERTYDAVVRNLQIIGDAAKQVPNDVRQQMPQIEWRKVAGMRDWIVHAYFGIDADILWDVITTKVPELEQAVRAYLNRGS